MTTADDTGGRTVAGRYRVLAEIGRGGMGIVYKAHDPRIDRMVALKTIRKDRYLEQESEAEALRRFRREARAAGKLSHPGIVTVYDIGEDGGEVYIAMEYVEGESLRAKMRQTPRFTVREAVSLIIQICSALDYAHRRSVIHRDVKPDNILCLEDGHVKLADFGIARVVTATTTLTMAAVGTPRYMAPEQWRGEAIDGRADLFSLGVVLYELVTGTSPFRGKTTTELMYHILNNEPRPPSMLDAAIPLALDAVVSRALARDPAARFASAAEMASGLETLLKAVPVEARSASPVRMTILRRGDMHLVDLAETDTLIPRSETRVDPSFITDITGEVERVAAGRGAGRGTTEAQSADAPMMVADRAAELRAIGALIYSQLLTEPARRKISTSPAGTDLYLRLDEQLVQIPWELCYDGHDFLATKFCVGRQVITERALPRAASEATASGTLEILIVADPTETLPAAMEEATAIEAQLARVQGVRVRRLTGGDIRRVPLLQALARSTIVHFAGHSTYDPLDPTRSGWVLRDGVLTAGEMAKLDRLPLLVFSNSCHAGATVGWDGASAYEGQAFGIGSAFLLAGVRNYIGTFWVAHDEESARFARAFYQTLLRGEAIGQALQAARRRIIEVRGWNELTWASYMLYGDPVYRLPLQRASAPEVTPSTLGPARAATTREPSPGTRWSLRRGMLPSAAALIGAAAAVLWFVTRPPKPPPTPEPTPIPTIEPTVLPTVAATASLPARYRYALEILDQPDLSDDEKVALVNGMAADHSDHAVIVLIAGARNISELVYMAAIRGLGGRPCHLVAPSLIELLEDEAWKRRAWAAKVLGEDRCREALRPLTEREERETDPRVRYNLEVAIKQLAEEVGR
ncbi:MAG: protein kinase [Deltaproteobacteria bacterium]|nr:protein kinase [Deltaproteobacteria bacterium]